MATVVHVQDVYEGQLTMRKIGFSSTVQIIITIVSLLPYKLATVLYFQ